MKYEEPTIQDCTTVVSTAYYHRSRYLNHADKFLSIFKRPLKDFWCNNITGFDIVGFDAWINPKQELSTAEFLLNKYGQETVDFIKGLF